MPAHIPTGCAINNGAKVPLFREGHMLGILIELHKSVGPIIARVDEQGEFPSLHHPRKRGVPGMGEPIPWLG